MHPLPCVSVLFLCVVLLCRTFPNMHKRLNPALVMQLTGLAAGICADLADQQCTQCPVPQVPALQQAKPAKHSHTDEIACPSRKGAVGRTAPGAGDAAIQHARGASHPAGLPSCRGCAACCQVQGLADLWDDRHVLPIAVWAEAGLVWSPVDPAAVLPVVVAVGHLCLLPGVLRGKLAGGAVGQPAAVDTSECAAQEGWPMGFAQEGWPTPSTAAAVLPQARNVGSLSASPLSGQVQHCYGVGGTHPRCRRLGKMSGSSSRAVRLPPSMLKFRFLQAPCQHTTAGTLVHTWVAACDCLSNLIAHLIAHLSEAGHDCAVLEQMLLGCEAGCKLPKSANCQSTQLDSTHRYQTARPGAPLKAVKFSCGVYRVRLRQSLQVQQGAGQGRAWSAQ